MSRFSGKCDLCDTIEFYDSFEKFKEQYKNIYIGNSDTPLEYNSLKDLVPYYAHITSWSCGDTIKLSSRPWIDIEEERLLNIYLENILKYYRSCKRKKIEFDIDESVRKNAFHTNENVIREISERVKEKGNKATIKGLHLSMYDRYRKLLQEEIAKFSNHDVTVHNKLVRDNIFDIIKENGDTPEGLTLSPAQIKRCLADKLVEEAEEFNKDKNEEEIADVLEVIDCIIESYGFDKNKIEKIKEKKKEEKGSFKKGLYLEQVVSKKKFSDENLTN